MEAVGDVGYISGLLDGVPDRPSIEHYVRIVRDKAILRGLISVSNTAIAKASDQAEPADEILNDAEAAVFQLSEKRNRLPQKYERTSRPVITSITPSRIVPTQCISVSHPSKLYVTDEYVVTPPASLPANPVMTPAIPK